MKPVRKRPNWLTVAVGILMLLLQAPFLPESIQYQFYSASAWGEVVRLNAGGFHPEVVFTTQAGERISFAGSSTFRTEVGDRLEVRYRPEEPRMAHLNQLRDIWAMELFFTGFGGILIIGGLFGMRLRMKGQGPDDA
jgi:hypothetical protein